jgi:glycosyltransferase involved in cell wall biosynthesis
MLPFQAGGRKNVSMSSNKSSLAGVVWIAWERQLRNRSLASRLGATLHEFDDPGPRLTRYLRCSMRTIRLLRRERPSVVFAPNPSLVLGCLLLALRNVFGFRFVSDAHFAGVEASGGARWLQRILDRFNRQPNLVIVTTDAHAQKIREVGGKPFVCQDPLPHIPEPTWGASEQRDKTVLFICSFDIDEPFEAAFEAARLLRGEGYRMEVTGNFRRADVEPESFPDVDLLGFVSHDEYYARLRSCSVALDLTEHDNCLVCGAYEALATSKPLVLSGTPALRDYFDRGTVFTRHEPEAIADAIRRAYEGREKLTSDATEWKSEAQQRMEEKLKALRAFCTESAQTESSVI